MFQSLIGTIKTKKFCRNNSKIQVSIPYRDDKNVFSFSFLQEVSRVSIPYRDDKNKNFIKINKIEKYVSIPYRDDKNRFSFVSMS